MDGSILGYSEDTGEGAIRTESGERYTFTKDDWKGERPPKTGDKVDFIGTDGKATEIYLLKSSFTAPDLSGIGDKFGDADSRAEMLNAVKSNATVGLFLTKPHVAGAGLIILGWLLAGHLLLILDVGEGFDAMGQLNDLARMTGGDSGIGLFRMIGILSLLLFYLIPIFAGWLIYKSMSDSETAKDKRRGAIAGLVLPIAVPVIAFFFIFIGLPGAFREAIFEGGRAAANSGLTLGDLIDIDFPWFLMIAGGVLIVLQLMGIVKQFGSGS
ncbi:MAG: hypothetical protein AAGJ85_07100 [Pseudomonadota bacterium]